MKNIAVKGCSLSLGTGSGSISISSTPSSKVKIDGKGVYSGGLNFSISGYTGGAITNGDGAGSGSISPGAMKVKADGSFVMLEGDTSVPVTINGTMPGPSGPQPAVAMDTVKISNAGQSKVKGA